MIDNRNEKKSAGGSAVLRGISKIYLWFQRKMQSGFLGKILCGYTKENEALSNSLLNSAVGNRSKLGHFVRKFRFLIAEQFEGSRILKLWQRFIHFLVGCQLRFYGSYFMTFGVYIGLIYFFKRFFFTSDGMPSISYLFVAAIMTVCSVPLLFSGRTLASAVKCSKSGNYIFSSIFGIPDEKMNVQPSRYGEIYNIAIFAGVVSGTLSFFLHPLYMIGAIGIFAAFALVITFPEIGVLIALGLLPILSAHALGRSVLMFVICVYSVGFFVKLIRGKRILNFEIIDLVILFFGVCVGFFGISPNIESSVPETIKLLIYLIGALVAGNLMRTKTWQKRSAYVTLAVSVFISMILVLQKICLYIGIKIPFLGIDVTFFDGGELLAGYLTISLMFAYAGAFIGKERKAKIAFLFTAAVIIFAIVIIKSPFGMIGAFVASWVFFFTITNKSLSAAIFAGSVIAGVSVVSHNFIPNVLRSFLGISADSIYSIAKVWWGSVDLVVAYLPSGTGIGGFAELYPMFAVAGFESVSGSGSLWLNLACEIGIIGLISFAAVIFVFIQNCFEYLTATGGRSVRGLVAAGHAAIIGIFVQSLFYNMFLSGAFFYAFFCIITILSAAIRTGRQDIIKKNEFRANTEMAASVDL